MQPAAFKVLAWLVRVWYTILNHVRNVVTKAIVLIEVPEYLPREAESFVPHDTVPLFLLPGLRPDHDGCFVRLFAAETWVGGQTQSPSVSHPAIYVKGI